MSIDHTKYLFLIKFQDILEIFCESIDFTNITLDNLWDLFVEHLPMIEKRLEEMDVEHN